MLTLVIGPPDSGKSRFAEDLAVKSGCGKRYYIATMKVMDEAGKNRIRKHRAQRLGKGFITIEEPDDITAAVNDIDSPEDSVVLVECLANLVGNVMHKRGDVIPAVIRQIRKLESEVCEVIVVTSEYEPESSDDEETSIYKKLLNEVNITITKTADIVYDMSHYIER